MEFKDYFSKQAKEYSLYRPKYPSELFEYLCGLVKEHNTAWDCATGNGQAALGLANYFGKVIATDASRSQINNALPHSKIEYRVSPAENSGLAGNSIDLITVASAIHWLDTDKFYAEVKRILKPGGVFAVWSYNGNNINPEVNKILEKFSHKVLYEHWPIESAIAWNFREKIQLPFEEIISPQFFIKLSWDLKDLLNYLYTWSSTQNYIKTRGINPLDELYKELINVWGKENEKKSVKIPLIMKAGRA